MSEQTIQEPVVGGQSSVARSTMNGKPAFTVPSKTVINFKSHFDKKLLCDGLTFTTGQACVYKCAFCYVPAMQLKAVSRFKAQGVVYPADGHFGVVIRIANAVALARQQILSKAESLRRQRLTIYASPKVDVAGNMDLVRETVEICKVILKLTNWDIRLLSKSNLLPKVAEMLEEWWVGAGATGRLEEKAATGRSTPRERVIYGVSTGTLDDKLAAAFEEGCPKVSKRIESLHWLQDNGFRTFGMICPSLPLANDYDYEHWAIGMHNAIRADRCEHVWAEVINLRGDSFERTVKCLVAGGFDAEALLLEEVMADKGKWENYARLTFEGHVRAQKFSRTRKLRFLQYVTKDTREWWMDRVKDGAVIL